MVFTMGLVLTWSQILITNFFVIPEPESRDSTSIFSAFIFGFWYHAWKPAPFPALGTVLFFSSLIHLMGSYYPRKNLPHVPLFALAGLLTGFTPWFMHQEISVEHILIPGIVPGIEYLSVKQRHGPWSVVRSWISNSSLSARIYLCLSSTQLFTLWHSLVICLSLKGWCKRVFGAALSCFPTHVGNYSFRSRCLLPPVSWWSLSWPSRHLKAGRGDVLYLRKARKVWSNYLQEWN